jgi:hypothetical protein
MTKKSFSTGPAKADNGPGTLCVKDTWILVGVIVGCLIASRFDFMW